MPRVRACGGRLPRSSVPCWSWRCPPLRSRSPPTDSSPWSCGTGSWRSTLTARACARSTRRPAVIRSRDRPGPRTATNSRSPTRQDQRPGPHHSVGDVLDDARGGRPRRGPGVVADGDGSASGASARTRSSAPSCRRRAGGSPSTACRHSGTWTSPTSALALASDIRPATPTGSATAAVRSGSRPRARQRRDRTRPAWSRRTAAQLAYVDTGQRRRQPGSRSSRSTGHAENRKITDLAGGRSPRWAPDGTCSSRSSAAATVMTVPARQGRHAHRRPRHHRRHRRRLAALHRRQTTVGCRSVLGADLQRDDRAGDDANRPARRAARPAVHRSGRAAAARSSWSPAATTAASATGSTPRGPGSWGRTRSPTG